MKAKSDQISEEIQVLYLCVFAFTIICTFIIIKLYPYFSHSTIQMVPLIVQRSGGVDYAALVAPKPMEQFTFLSLSCFIPVMTLFTVLILNSYKISIANLKLFRSKIIQMGILFCIIVTFIYPLYNSDFFSVLLTLYRFEDNLKHLAIITALVLIASYVVALRGCLRELNNLRSMPRDTERERKKLITIWGIFSIAMCLDIAAFRLYSVHSISLASPVHFDAAVYAISQVVNGKTLLVDLPSQYGLFPEILAPLFAIMGTTIKSITSLFAMLQIISTSAILFVLSKLIKNSKLLLLSGGLAFLLVTFSTPLFLIHVHEPYYQYWPIRFFWPSISVLAFYFFAEKKTIGRFVLLSLSGAIGAFWNVDSGIFIILALCAYLGAKFIFSLYESKNIWKWLQLISAHIIITLMALAALFYYLMLKSQSSLNFYWALQYQKTFYQMGFMDIPLPYYIHPWISVLGIYLFGFIFSLYSWIYDKNRQCSDMVFFLSFLGLGLFTYYEGRSHVLNLTQVCWPAIIVSMLMTNQIFKGVQLKRIPQSYLALAAAAIGFYLICDVVFVTHVRAFIKSAYDVASEAINPKDHLSILTLNELDFIKGHTKNQHVCLILSKRPSIYYVEAQLSSPVKGPGLIEMVLQSDQDNLMNAIATQHLDCIFFGIGESETYANIDLNQVLQNYVIADKNSLGTLLFLQPKKSMP